MDTEELSRTAQALVTAGKGVLAADESTPTIKRRFDSINVECTEENRRDYREMLFGTSGIAEYISGVILFDETIRQTTADGKSFVKELNDQGIIAGIKVDKGTRPLREATNELITEGLDGLTNRLSEYAEIGARFTKWRSVITIGPFTPTQYCIKVNAHSLARYAALSQEAGLVPIVEPEVLMDGDHDIDRCFEVTEETFREVFYELGHQRVAMDGMLLKPSMVVSGAISTNRADPNLVAEKTIACLKRTVPAAVPGIVFLSGGQDADEATLNLDAINRLASSSKAPWELSFSFGRGLQAGPLKVWAGKPENIPQAQRAFLERCRLTSAARQGNIRSKAD